MVNMTTPLDGIKIVALSGKAETGKDHFIKHVLTPLGFKQFSLAWHLKCGLVGKGIATYDEVFNTKPAHVRKEMQLEGTERGRMVYGEDIWLKTTSAWLQLFRDTWGTDKFVIGDVRFPNEAEYVRKLGGKVIRIHAPDRAENSKLSPEARLHPSETALDGWTLTDFDGVVDNSYAAMHSSEEALRQVLKNIGVI